MSSNGFPTSGAMPFNCPCNFFAKSVSPRPSSIKVLSALFIALIRSTSASVSDISPAFVLS